jgi:hypothetical protein
MYQNIYLLTSYYHIFCCNMFVFACPIIAKSQCWLFALRTNTGQISVFALIYPYLPPNSTSGICAVVSKIINRQSSGESASLPQYDEGTESAEVATSERLYVKVQGKMMHKDMHKIVFQSN